MGVNVYQHSLTSVFKTGLDLYLFPQAAFFPVFVLILNAQTKVEACLRGIGAVRLACVLIALSKL